MLLNLQENSTSLKMDFYYWLLIFHNVCTLFFFSFQKTLSDLYPKCAVQLYGSTVNGLGFKGCDIDAFVDLGMKFCIIFSSCDEGKGG